MGTKQNNHQQKLDRFKAICKAKGIKLTPQRLIIYEELIKTDEHPSTEMLYQKIRKKFPTISVDTVNRTLLTFHKIGVAGLVEGSGNPKRFDGNLNKHHHVECVKCKKIVDFYNDVYNNLPIPQEIQDNFRILRQTVRIEGICKTCSQEA